MKQIYDHVAGEFVELPDGWESDEHSGDITAPDGTVFFVSGPRGRWGFQRAVGTGRRARYASLKAAIKVAGL